MALNLTGWLMAMAVVGSTSWWTASVSIGWWIKNLTAPPAWQAEDLMAKLRNEARDGRLNLPKGRKLAFSFKREAAEKYLEKQISTQAKNLNRNFINSNYI